MSMPSGPRASGMSRRCRLNPSTAKRVLSEIHSSLMSSFVLGCTRITSPLAVSIWIDGPHPSSTSTEFVVRYSHERAAKALGLEVSAPTGHKSTTLPDISESRAAATYVEISIALPRPTVPSMLTPATSWEKRTHRCERRMRREGERRWRERGERGASVTGRAGDGLERAFFSLALSCSGCIARHRGLDERPEVLVLDRALRLVVARAVGAVRHRLVLQIALAALVANRAIQVRWLARGTPSRPSRAFFTIGEAV